jgi:hypothetical protein
MRRSVFYLALIVVSSIVPSVDAQDAAKPFRVRNAGPGVIAIEIENPGPGMLECVTTGGSELGPGESIGLELWTGNVWISVVRPFEDLQTPKVPVKPGERLARLWRESWGEPGRYRATIDCGGTRFTPVEFEVPAAGKFAVTAASLKADVPALGAPCPVTVKFTGEITTNGPGIVSYRLVRSDGATGPEYKLDFKAAGTQSVGTTWMLGGAGLPSYEGWITIRILSPNEMESEQNAGRFAMACKQ